MAKPTMESKSPADIVSFSHMPIMSGRQTQSEIRFVFSISYLHVQSGNNIVIYFLVVDWKALKCESFNFIGGLSDESIIYSFKVAQTQNVLQSFLIVISYY